MNDKLLLIESWLRRKQRSPMLKRIVQLLINESNMSYSLMHRPPLLYDPERKIALLWSAKSGSYSITKWFFFQMGLLEQAEAHARFVHKYRTEVYYNLPFYKEQLADVVKDDYTILKLIRNPYTRAVSSYVHAIRHRYIDKPVARYLKRKVDVENKFSFEEFLLYLSEACYIKRCNIHHQQQYSPLEQNRFLEVNYMIHLENIEEDLRRVEADLDLPAYEFEPSSKSPHHTTRYETKKFCGKTRFTRDALMNGANVPHFQAFYNERLKTMVEKIYSADFENYDFLDLDF